MFQKSEYYYYIFILLIITIGMIMIASPHFPNSEVSEQNNKDAFIALTTIGTLVIIPFAIWGFKIFKATTYSDLSDYLSDYLI
jgi:hypothetical protein